MRPTRAEDDLATFEALRPDLLALAYRMLGDVGRAQDMVQEAWIRWHQRHGDVLVEVPRSYLVTIVTRLCLNELGSARVRREESRSDRLPEPVDLAQGGMARLESFEDVSMAFMVVLERLSPAERAVLLLHDVFDFDHDDIAALVERSPAACRKLLERARQRVVDGRRMLTASREEHARLLAAFVGTAERGDVAALAGLLAEDAVLITDGGREGRRVGRFRNLRAPLVGAPRVAAFVAATARAAGGALGFEPHELNGRPALLLLRGGQPFAALLLGVAGGRIERVFFHADPDRLRFVGRVPVGPG